MPIQSHGVALRSILLTLAFALAHSGSMLAQEVSPSAWRPPPPDSRAIGPVETAAVELPSAPLPTTTAPTLPANPTPAVPVAFVPVIAQPKELGPHRFWDRENSALFATAGALAAADFCATHANLASGGEELNPVTRVFARSTPLLATNFVLETASVVGISYVLHKTGHHKLERATSFVSIGASAGAAGYSFSHR